MVTEFKSLQIIGQMKGSIRDLEVESSSEEDDDDSAEQEFQKSKSPQKKSGGMLSMFKSLVGSKSLSEETMRPVLEQLRVHLISKNVAIDIAEKLCDSICTKLEGKVLGTFDSVASTVKSSLTDALVQILSPKRRVDILRDAFEAKKNSRPYVMAFCGVNGVGKSTNLAKICFWLIENNFRVLIAACDTFRAGAVEQLRTHMKHLNALHPPEKHGGFTMVQLYEKGTVFYTIALCIHKICNFVKMLAQLIIFVIFRMWKYFWKFCAFILLLIYSYNFSIHYFFHSFQLCNCNV